MPQNLHTNMQPLVIHKIQSQDGSNAQSPFQNEVMITPYDPDDAEEMRDRWS
jgi:hypothetical protein